MSRPMQDDTLEILALYALGVPTDALCSWFPGVSPGNIRNLAHYHGVSRPDLSDGEWCARVARVERIKRHIYDYPNVSLFSEAVEVAA